MDIYRFIIIINLGYHPVNIIITPIHFQRINTFKGQRFFDHYKRTATSLPYFFRIRGRRNNLLFTLSTGRNTDNRRRTLLWLILLNNKFSPLTRPRNNRNKGIKILFFYFYKILLLHTLDPIIYKIIGTDRSTNKGADRKINRNKTPRWRKKDLGRKYNKSGKK